MGNFLSSIALGNRLNSLDLSSGLPGHTLSSGLGSLGLGGVFGFSCVSLSGLHLSYQNYNIILVNS